MTAPARDAPAAVEAPADRLARGVIDLGRRIEAASATVGRAVRWDWLAVLTERARLRHLTPRGRTTAGGAGRLLRCGDGWIAVQLARPDDHGLLDAWFALADPGRAVDLPRTDPAAPWEVVARAVRPVPGAALTEAAAVVGLAVGVLGERAPDPDAGVRTTHRRPLDRRDPVRVVDLSSLWAGPLCGAVLCAAGAEVVKVESAGRPDGARRGDPGLYARLQRDKELRVVDLATATGRSDLAALVRDADVVLESSRPRALEQLGLPAADELAAPGGPGLWVSITGHGRGSPRVSFGDDAAVAGGLVDQRPDGPRFRGDALADPLSGLSAAATALELLAADRGGLVDVAMAGVAAAHAEPLPGA